MLRAEVRFAIKAAAGNDRDPNVFDQVLRELYVVFKTEGGNVSDDVIIGRSIAVLKGIFGNTAVPQASISLFCVLILYAKNAEDVPQQINKADSY